MSRNHDFPGLLSAYCPGTSQQGAASAAACRSGGGRFGNSLPRGNCGCQLQMPVTAADGSRCSRLWTVDCGLRVVDHKLWIATGKVKIISLTSTLWRRAEHRPVRLMEPFSFHQTHRHRSSGSCRRAGVADEFHFPPVTQAPSGRLACDTQSRSQSQFPPGIPTVRQYTRSVSEIRAADRATEPAASGEACRPRQ